MPVPTWQHSALTADIGQFTQFGLLVCFRACVQPAVVFQRVSNVFLDAV